MGCSLWGLQRVGHDWAISLSLFTFMHWRRKRHPSVASVPAWRIPGMREPGGLLSMGSHRVGHDRSDLAAAAAYTPHVYLKKKKNRTIPIPLSGYKH